MAPYLRTMRILWGAMLGTVGLLAVLLLAGIRAEEPAPRDLLLPCIFASFSIGGGALSFLLPKSLFKQAAARADVEIVNDPVPDALVAGFRQAAPTHRVFADTLGAERAAAFAFNSPFVLSLALSESVGLMGFVLGFMGFVLPVWAPFMAVSVVLIALKYPTRETITKGFERARGARFAPPAS
jgi:hypothetical protein